MAAAKKTEVKAKATVCPVSLETFLEKMPTAMPKMREKLAEEITLTPKEFSTGSFGVNGAGKITVLIDGQPVKFQVTLNITAVGSKEAPRKNVASQTG